MKQILSYKNIFPKIHKESFISNSIIIGQVTIKRNASIWYNTILRGDVGKICIGEGTNIQDNTVIHVDRNFGDTIIGNMVTVGHSCIMHACKISDNVFVGMGSLVMDNVYMEEFSMLAAGSLVTKGKVIKSGELWAGRPAKFFRLLDEEEIKSIKISAMNYIELAGQYNSS